MKMIRFQVVYQVPYSQGPYLPSSEKSYLRGDELIVRARTINAGFKKAAIQASSGIPIGWELKSIEFGEVIS